MVLLLACQTPTHIALPTEESIESGESAVDTTPPEDTGPFPTAKADGNPLAGYPPLVVELTAEGSTSPSDLMLGSWVLSDGGTKEGLDVTYAFADEGTWDATLTIDDGTGSTASDTVQVYVRSLSCPVTGETERLGEVVDEKLTEISGVVDSPTHDQTLWVHNDAGHDPIVFALGYDGAIQAEITLDVARGDLEDIGRADVDGVSTLFVGDIGDNGRDNVAYWVHLLPEPTLEDQEVQVTTLTLTYPEGEAHDSESLFVDPVTGDLFLVTKDSSGTSKLFRKAAPHVESTTELELMHTLDFANAPLSGSLTTAASIHPDGSQIVVRTYRQQGYLWPRAEGQTVTEAMQAIPCEITLPMEPQSESVAFSVDGSSLFTVSERGEIPVNRTPLQERD